MIVENHRFLQYFPLKIQFVCQKINPYVIAFFLNNPKMKIKIEINQSTFDLHRLILNVLNNHIPFYIFL
jgi:hypothetical protein